MKKEKLEAGTKFDEGKARFDLLPGDVLVEISKVFTYGATKYEERNWEKGMKWGRLFAATMRHLWSWWMGEENDKETGISHLAHAGCNVMFLIRYHLRKDLYGKNDDRYILKKED